MNNQNSAQSKSSNLIPVSIIMAGVIIAGAVIYTKSSRASEELSQKPETAQVLPEKEPAKSPSIKLEITENDHIRGNPEAPITIVEFSDFQCPFCQRFHPTLQQALKDYPEQVRWVYKHFPLGFHQQAQPAAEASECAAEQGKFWEFADGLFENQARLGEDLYEELAQKSGLNPGQFKECLSSRKYQERVQADYQQGVKAGVTGTPGSFVNGQLVSGAVPYETLRAAVEKALAELK